MRIARGMAIVWAASWVILIAIGFSLMILGQWQEHVATTQPTTINTMSYVDHGMTFYAPAFLLTWLGRLRIAFIISLMEAIAASVVAQVAGGKSNAIERRWKRH